MEKYKFETGPERIPSKEEVLSVIGRFAENTILMRELSDDQGLYLLEASVESKEQGETIQFEYIRKGEFSNNNKSSATTIHKVYYQDGIPCGGQNVADYNEETGEWVEVK